jgi:hypothetical protein
MNFGEYASKLRTQVAEAAKKIPTFDDMAAKDDYIHSQEFNVRGQARKKPEAISKNIEPDEASSLTSSWSLLDRQPLQKVLAAVQPNEETTQTPLHQGVGGQSAIERTSPISANTSISSGVPPTTQRRPSQSSIASLPWLAVVANTLGEKGPPGKGEEHDSGGFSSDVSCADDTDSLDTDVDDDDPILSMIRTSQVRKVKARRPQRPGTEEKISTKQRFLHDARIAGSHAMNMEAGLILETPARETQSHGDSGFKGPFGGLFIDIAKAQLDRFVRRPDLDHGRTRSDANAPPPLARERTNHKQKPVATSEEDYDQTASSAVFGEDDLAQLARLRTTSFCSTYVQNLGFVVVTFFVALYIYYYQQAADQVS